MIFGIGAAVLYSAMTVESIFIGRFVVGWAVAVSGIADVSNCLQLDSGIMHPNEMSYPQHLDIITSTNR